jgi:hypothetical protein
MRQNTGHRLALLGDHQRHGQTRTIPLLTRCRAAILVIGVALGASHPPRGADRDGAAIKNGAGRSIEGLPYLPSEVEAKDKDVLQTMASSTTPTLAQPVRHGAVVCAQCPSPFMMAPEAESRREGGGHHCGVVQLTLGVFLMVYG